MALRYILYIKYMFFSTFFCNIFRNSNFNEVKSFCWGSRGTVFSKRVPLAAGKNSAWHLLLSGQQERTLPGTFFFPNSKTLSYPYYSSLDLFAFLPFNTDFKEPEKTEPVFKLSIIISFI
jgi:hypothetical protein